MTDSQRPPQLSDKPLFTPGPLTTSMTVKQAMLRDLGSRDDEFIDLIKHIRTSLLALVGVSKEDGYEAVPMQGSGTFAIESVISSVTPPDGKWLVIINGAYGKRIESIAKRYGIATAPLTFRENQLPSLTDIDLVLRRDPAITNVAVVHCETTAGIMNPIEEIGQLVKQHNRSYFVDSMSALGGVEFDFRAANIDYIVSSANKCVEGVPGFSFAICRRDALQASANRARTVSLDLYDQWRGLEKNGQFRFTPPTHTMLAFAQALRELQEEGGVAARAKRYQANREVVLAGMRKLGFEEYVPAELQGHIITSFLYPDDERFGFEEFYERLNLLGFVIYPGKVTDADCFRIGHIGRLYPKDSQALLGGIETALREMGLDLPLRRKTRAAKPVLAANAGGSA